MGELQGAFARDLNLLRLHAGLSIKALAKRSGMSSSSLGDLLRGKWVKVPPLERVSAVVRECLGAMQSTRSGMPTEEVQRLIDLDWWREQHADLVRRLERSARPASSREGPPIRALPERAPSPLNRPHRQVLPVADRLSKAAAAPERRPGEVTEPFEFEGRQSVSAACLEASAGRRRFGVVPLRADAFQGRAVTDVLVQTAPVEGSTARTGNNVWSVSVLTGLGGVGKTQLAADYSHTQWAKGRVDLLMWIDARTRDAITAAYAEVAADLLGQNPANPERTWRRLLEWLAETSITWLVVLDDLQAPADLSGLWPPLTANGQVVVTTRCRDAALQGHRRRIIEVGLFTPVEAVAYLAEKLSDRASIDAADRDLIGLADDLGYLPLALAQSAAYLGDKPLLSCADYRVKLADQRTKLREVLPKDRELPDEHERTVAATWSLSIDAANQLHPAGLAGAVLELASVLDPAGIPAAVFATRAAENFLTARLDRDIDTDEIRDGLEYLRRFSLVTLDPGQPHRVVRTHALVQRAVRDTISCETSRDLAWAAADAIKAAWPSIETDEDTIQSLRSNVIALQDAVEEHLWQPRGHPVLFLLVRSLGGDELFESAVAASERLLRQASTRLGPNHPDTFSARQDVAIWRGAGGDPASAKTALEELLVDALRVLGADHTLTLETRGYLAHWCGEAGDPDDAVHRLEQLIPDLQRVLGTNHHWPLLVQHSLATWNKRAKGLSGRKILEELSSEFVRVKGSEDFDTLAVRYSLAVSLGEEGDITGAMAAVEQMLPDLKRILGPGHRLTLVARSRLEMWRGEAGDPAAAVAALGQLVPDLIRVLGASHPYVLNVRNCVATWGSVIFGDEKTT
ncbi:NB-ARC domain-containing protein [Amycolatopsis sp. NPDC098790]|uniref:NB-ARC domain-containing protein n=1 Tax=Amycolatopsis sp. NPDC098790 TaxID=3363939 RepID=UPI0038227C01